MTWLVSNLGTIIVVLIVAAVVAAVFLSMIKDKKSGKSSCGCGCENCALHGHCRKAKQ